MSLPIYVAIQQSKTPEETWIPKSEEVEDSEQIAEGMLCRTNFPCIYSAGPPIHLPMAWIP